MASAFTEARKSLVAEPRKYIIMARRVSEGGELILVKHPSEETVECESDKRKGRVCILGPLTQKLIMFGGCGDTTLATKGCHTAGTSRNDPVLMRSAVPDTLFVYQQYKLDIKALRPTEVKGQEKLRDMQNKQGKSKPIQELKILDEPPPVENIEAVEQRQQIMETESKATEDAQPPEETGKTERNVEMKQPTWEAERSKIFGNVQPKDKFDSLPSAPLSSISEYSVLVKWKQHPSIPCYSLKNVFDVLSQYGTVAAMGHLSVNSCLVLFEQFSVAVNVVRESLLGPKAYPLICTWYYSYMYLDSLELLDVHPYKKHKIESEESKQLRQFRDMQEQVIACLKGRGAQLSYDRSTFKA